MLWKAVVLVISAMPKVTVIFHDPADAAALGSPTQFTTQLDTEWYRYECHNTIAKPDKSLICEKFPVTCLHGAHGNSTLQAIDEKVLKLA